MFTSKAVNANGNHKYPELKLCLSYLLRKSEDERRRFLAFDVFKFTQLNGAVPAQFDSLARFDTGQIGPGLI